MFFEYFIILVLILDQKLFQESHKERKSSQELHDIYSDILPLSLGLIIVLIPTLNSFE